MEFRKTSSIALAALVIAGACFSTSAAAAGRHDRHVVRDILLAPLLLPAAIVAASTPRTVVYEDTYYARPHYRVEHRRHYAPPPRHDMRRHDGYRGDTRHYHYR